MSARPRLRTILGKQRLSWTETRSDETIWLMWETPTIDPRESRVLLSGSRMASWREWGTARLCNLK